MSKFTTTINEYITGELKRLGHGEFINNGDLTYNDSEYAFIQKILFYDEDVQKIVDDKIFKGFKFTDEDTDRSFKEIFVARFLDREINRQTIEAFASQVLYVTLTHQDWILKVFGEDLEKYVNNHVTNESEETGTQDQTTKNNQTNTQNVTGKDTTENREALSTLPQNEINIDVDNDELDYADENTISKDKKNNEQETTGEQKSDGSQKQESNTTQESLNKTYNMTNLQELYALKDQLFMEYDKKCFLQIW